MNLPQTVMSNSVVTQPSSTLFNHQPQFPPHAQWGSTDYNACHLPLQLSQYYNVFPEAPVTKTSWTFPNGCVTSNIVRFTGNPTPSCHISASEFKSSNAIPVKRKSLTSDDEPQPSKILITEEKMAARMSAPVTGADVDDEFLECSPETVSQPQLVVCDELRNLSKDMNSIIPEPLVPFEKSLSTALVLWRPPVSYLNVVQVPPEEEYSSRSSVIITDITDRPDLDNNNISTVDLNTLLHPPFNDDNLEVMEM